ncbi:hypothetical protein C474_08532 [Halogeometricum pallidum JCM 14848]|uniref:Uncharacterized protein n=1 Tax=Halogeometricum pallidum JCM 14848 TaxID=1227487 RepID=M0DAX6_HALPD|nr:hypothetical protein [Halogeometricum pallidum]ELZ31334.1 hypothetical protein C474_08532 [Halogeometricum pallidum JCM 14848]
MTENTETDDDGREAQNSSNDAESGTSTAVTRRGALTALGAAGLLGYLGTGRASAEVLSGVDNTAPQATQVIAGGRDNTIPENATMAAITGGRHNEASGEYSFVGGGGGEEGDRGNRATALHTAVCGGAANRAGSLTKLLPGAFVGGGTGNEATDAWTVIAGGTSNEAGDPAAAVLGGMGNEAGNTATVGAGRENSAFGGGSVVGGGLQNEAVGKASTVSGGFLNETSALGATVGGGGSTDVLVSVGGVLGTMFLEPPSDSTEGNRAFDEFATVAGGADNVAGSDNEDETSAPYSTVGGGRANVAENDCATVPGGRSNVAAGEYSLAAGRRAAAAHRGAFVWSDGEDAAFGSTGAHQFLVDAAGGVGLGHEAPEADVLDVRGAAAGSARDPASSIAYVENESQDASADVLALKVNTEMPGPDNDFVTFLNGRDDAIGTIEGNGSGGVTYTGAGGDFGEYFPKADPDATFAPGEVVGLRGGEITRTTADADTAFVVTDRPIVLGNNAEDTEDRVAVAMLGQVPVDVAETVDAGDLLVATDAADGRARVADGTPAAPVVGRALTSASEDEESVDAFVNASVDGAPNEDASAARSDADRIAALESTLDRKDERIDDLEAETERKEARIDELESRLAAVEQAVEALPTGGTMQAD